MFRKRKWLQIPVVLVMLGCGYVASVGPASVVADRYPVLDQYLQFYYAPLIVIARYTPLGWPLGRYEMIWRDAFRK